LRVIIDNDKYQLYARTDYVLSEITLLNNSAALGATSIEVVNNSGFATDDYVLIGDIGTERSEIRKITVSSNNFAVTALSFAHTSKTKVYRLQYNQVKFFQDSLVIDTVDIASDYFTKTEVDIDDTKMYSVSYYNSTSAEESPEGEVCNGYEYNLCSIGDVIQYEDATILGRKVIDKINIASREIRSMFISQEQEFTDLSSRDVVRLREPVALRALYYVFLELIKKDDDVATKKVKLYNSLYATKLSEVTDVINKENDDIEVWGQSQVIR